MTGPSKSAIWALLIAADAASAAYLAATGPFPSLVQIGASIAYRNIYIHVPAAFAIYISSTAALVTALYDLARRRDHTALMDRAALATVSLGWFAFISGTLWASESWGSAWASDPLQISILVLALVYSIYPAIRRQVEDPERNIKLARAYVIAAYTIVMIAAVAPYIAPLTLHPAPGTPIAPAMAIPMLARTLLVALGVITYLLIGPAGRSAYAYLALLLVAAYLGWPWLAYSPARVVSVNGNTLYLSDGRSIAVASLSSLITPAYVDGKPTVVGNFVAEVGGKILLVTHWSVPINLALYGMALFLLHRMRL